MLCHAAMKTALLALAALLASTAHAEMMIDNVNGIQVGADGKLQHFTGLLISDDGKVIRTTGPLDDIGVPGQRIDGGGRTLLPGLIDAHGHVMALGFGALQLDLTGTASLAELQQRLRDYAAANPHARWIVGR